jgi:hypothetical protein
MRRWIAIILIFALVFPCCAYAHDKQKEHDEELKQVLFGNKDVILPSDQQQAFQHIANAISFCIDQFSTTEVARAKSSLYDELKRDESLPYSFEEVELQKNEFGKNITGQTHRKYTHRGWEFSEYPLKDLWKKRQEIVRLTVNKELFGSSDDFFAFSWLPWNQSVRSADKKQVEAFCALLYYVHILGDHIEAETYSAEEQILVPISSSHDLKSPSIVGDLKKYLPDLFPTQKTKRLYGQMIDELNEIGARAEEQYYFHPGGIRTQEQFDAYHKCAEDLLVALSDYIPKLLKNEEFFSYTFK